MKNVGVSTGSRILGFTVQISTVVCGIILGSIINSGACIVDPIRKVLINPGSNGNDGDSKPAKGQEAGGDNYEKATNGNPDGAGYDDQGREQNEGEEDENGAGDYEAKDPEDLGTWRPVEFCITCRQTPGKKERPRDSCE